MIKTILVFGDSIAWGRVPGAQRRYPFAQRWPFILEQTIGRDRVRVVDDAVPGRTTVFDEPYRPHRKGTDTIDMALTRHAPIDLLIIALGTNDLHAIYGAGVAESALGAAALIDRVRRFGYDPEQSPPRILLLGPPPIVKPAGSLRDKFRGAAAKSKGHGAAFAAMARERGCGFFDLAPLIKPDPRDGVHLDVAATRKIAVALAPVVARLLAT